jgi:hypothetical protein
VSDPRRCGIPAKTLPPCDLEWGHDGDMHANAGDGFYARDYEELHQERRVQRRHRLGLCVDCGKPILGSYSITIFGRVHGAVVRECET